MTTSYYLFLLIAITQGKKSYYDGDSFWANSNDINNAVFANLGIIIIGNPTIFSTPFYGTRMTSKIPTLFNIFFSYRRDNILKTTTFMQSLTKTLTRGANRFALLLGYGLTASQYYNLCRAIFNTPDFENSNWTLY